MESLEKVVANLVQKVERHFYGKYRSFVVDNADPEQLGRLKLKIPSLLGPNVVTGWATPCLPYGGDMNQGTLFIPEVGAGIWVEFEEGDLEFPIWVGTFWSKPKGQKSELPKPNNADGTEQENVQGNDKAPPTRKIIKTKHGHTIQFEDAKEENKDEEDMVTIIEATHKHVITMNKEGIKITEGTTQNIIDMKSTQDEESITMTEGKHQHVIMMNKEGVKITEGTTQNIINMESTKDQESVTITQAQNVITMNQDGIKITDGTNQHEIVLDNKGITLTDANENSIEMTKDAFNITSKGTFKIDASGQSIEIIGKTIDFQKG